ncbi:MAG: carotenoid oxygenase family protein [Nannocystaceae bacterium]
MTDQNLSRTHDFEPARIEGRIPDDLRGTLYRTGPALFERAGRRVPHSFLADGAVSAVRFGDGRAERAVKFVAGALFREEEAAGRFRYGVGASPLRRLWHSLRGTVKCTGNTALLRWQDQLFALMEAGRPVEVSPATLDTLGERDLEVIARSFSAHPHRVPARETTYNFGVRYGREMSLDLYALPDRGPARPLGAVTSSRLSMVHDFVATERALIFYVAPAKLRVWRAIVGTRDFAKWFDWRPELGGEWIVVPIDAPERVRRIPAPAFWVWHFANAFDDGDEVVIDAAVYEDLDSLRALATGDIDTTPPTLTRIRLGDDGERGREVLTEMPGEFLSVPASQRARRHDTIWSVALPEPDRVGVARHDLERGETDAWVPDANEEASEPVLTEGERWALSLVHDREAGESHVAVLDARDLQAGPRARVYLGQRIPMTFHGLWWPAA